LRNHAWEIALGGDGRSTYPGGSRQRVNRAGDNVRAGTATENDLAVIDEWRAAHRPVLNTFQAILRNRTRGKDIIVAQRHKRRRTIFGKLERFPRMQLSRMDDVAGCRLIFQDIESLYEFRYDLHAARFNHRLRNENDKYDYIEYPKATGYRGVHDIYEYDVRSTEGERYKGLLIELQYRTIYQHAWATCVEVVGFITESQPKFEQGDTRYQHVLSLASEIIARNWEGRYSSHLEMDSEELVHQSLLLDGELGFMRMLRGLNAADSDISGGKNVILIFADVQDLEIRTYRDATDALRALFELERSSPSKDIVLVRADTTEEMRISFKNYFSDAREFINLIDEGCQALSGRKTGRLVRPSRRRGAG
jgi:putative GTP pyrophosphokinase